MQTQPLFCWVHLNIKGSGTTIVHQQSLLQSLKNDLRMLICERRVPQPNVVFVTDDISDDKQKQWVESWLLDMARDIGLHQNDIVMSNNHDIDNVAVSGKFTFNTVRTVWIPAVAAAGDYFSYNVAAVFEAEGQQPLLRVWPRKWIANDCRFVLLSEQAIDGQTFAEYDVKNMASQDDDDSPPVYECPICKERFSTNTDFNEPKT